MNSRWYNISVLILWLATMSWLVTQKILPSLLVGDPPDRMAVLASQSRDRTVGCDVFWEEEPIGTAIISAEPLLDGSTEVKGHLRFDRLPIGEIVPEFIKILWGSESSLPEQVPLNATSSLHFEPDGRLLRFESEVALEPSVPVVQIDGLVDGESVLITVRSRGLAYETRHALPGDVMVGDALFPQTRLPGLRTGRKWTVQLYSPLRPRVSPMEIMQAEVVGREPLLWSGRSVNSWLVVYRSDPGSDVGRAGKERAWIWVRDDGVVLKQSIRIFDKNLTFVRMTRERCGELQRCLNSTR